MGYGGTTGWKHSGKINWEKVSVEGGKLAPVGLYEGKVVKAEPKTSSTDKPMLEVKIELIGADDADNREEGVGALVFDNWVLTEDGAFKMKQFAMASGVELPESVDYDEVSKFADEIIGATVALVVKHRTFDGRARANVDYYGAEPPKDGEKSNSGNNRRRRRR